MNIQKFFGSSFFAGLLIGVLATASAADMLGSTVFPDVQQGAYFDAPIGRLYSEGIIKGAGDGRFHPADFVTRADVAVMLDRALFGGGTTASSVSRRSSSSRTSSSSSTSSSISSVANVGEAGAFRFSVDKVSFPEGASNVSLSVQRYGGAKGNALVTYKTANGTAESGKRYNEATGQVAFGDGQTSKVVSLTLVNNLIADPNQTFTVTLSEPTGGAVIGTPSVVTITVLDNDGGGGNSTNSSSSSSAASGSAGSSAAGGNITLSAWAYALDEGGGSLPVTVLRKGSSSSAVTVGYSTTQGTATAGINYTETNGTLSFAAGETSKSFSIPFINNNTIEGNKNFTLKLASVTGGASLDTPNSVQVTVVDDEAIASGTGTVLFSSDTYTHSQSAGGSALVTVYRRGGYGGTVTVTYATSDSTAIANADYTSTSGTLTFAPGESNKTFSVPIIAGKFVGSKRINLTLGTITGPAILGSQPTAALNIQGQ
ncbi:MAG: hypothetical protein HOO67_04035 [Candidatus Peribacteraceae bacterium]|nr:hypothetical protein [Candidatus Peribacteraceae bacterium]